MSVTHHVEEMPPSTTHVGLMREGTLVAVGRADDVLNDALLSRCFGVDITVTRQGGSWAAHVRRARW